MECKNTNIMIQSVTPGLIKADENPNENALTYVLPNMNNFVRNTVDSLGVSSTITGSWFFSMEVLNIILVFIYTTLFQKRNIKYGIKYLNARIPLEVLQYTLCEVPYQPRCIFCEMRAFWFHPLLPERVSFTRLEIGFTRAC